MSKSTDEKVTIDVIQSLEDGKSGFEKAAEKLTESTRPELAAKMTEYAGQRSRFATELRDLAAQYGDDIEKEGSVAGAMHRGWMAVKDAISGDDPEGVLDAAEQGEDHAVSEYKDALDEDISPRLRTVLERQYADVKAAHDSVKMLRNTNS
ncbi:MAG: PA2169 family four-helix-bundle protein [Ilumatobacteraceae bacterium]